MATLKPCFLDLWTQGYTGKTPKESGEITRAGTRQQSKKPALSASSVASWPTTGYSPSQLLSQLPPVNTKFCFLFLFITTLSSEWSDTPPNTRKPEVSKRPRSQCPVGWENIFDIALGDTYPAVGLHDPPTALASPYSTDLKWGLLAGPAHLLKLTAYTVVRSPLLSGNHLGHTGSLRDSSPSVLSAGLTSFPTSSTPPLSCDDTFLEGSH